MLPTKTKMTARSLRKMAATKRGVSLAHAAVAAARVKPLVVRAAAPLPCARLATIDPFLDGLDLPEVAKAVAYAGGFAVVTAQGRLCLAKQARSEPTADLPMYERRLEGDLAASRREDADIVRRLLGWGGHAPETVPELASSWGVDVDAALSRVRASVSSVAGAGSRVLDGLGAKIADLVAAGRHTPGHVRKAIGGIGWMRGDLLAVLASIHSVDATFSPRHANGLRTSKLRPSLARTGTVTYLEGGAKAAKSAPSKTAPSAPPPKRAAPAPKPRAEAMRPPRAATAQRVRRKSDGSRSPVREGDVAILEWMSEPRELEAIARFTGRNANSARNLVDRYLRTKVAKVFDTKGAKGRYRYVRVAPAT